MTAETERPPVSAKRGWSASRIVGHAVMGIWIAGALGLLWFLIDSYSPEFTRKYGPSFLSGFLVTAKLVILSIIVGAAISIPIAFGRMSRNPIIGGLSFAYVYFFRGTPLLAQTFLVYYGAGSFVAELKAIGLWGFFRDPFNCAVFTFSLNTSAYQAEILRGAILNVGRGQVEAAAALGLKRFPIFWKVVLPQALIVALRPYGNEIILMIKGSAIASIVTVFDLMGETRRAFSRTFDFQTYLWAAILYLMTVETLRRIWDVLEARLTRHLRRSSD
ncbi:MAG: ABC transporter permease [Hyphomicrobiales bacterium]|nr:ABC transporter permease [Hyphomicrobiales bacterium]